MCVLYHIAHTHPYKALTIKSLQKEQDRNCNKNAGGINNSHWQMQQKQAIIYKLTSGETCREWGWDRSDLIGKLTDNL